MAPAFAAYSPPTSGLIGWWSGNGNANDSAGGHNGTLEGGMGFTSGVFGQAFLGGTQERVYIPDSPDFALTSFSIGAWVDAYANSWVVFFRGDNRAPGLDPYQLGMDFNGNIGLQVESSTQTDSLYVPITYNQWHQVTATFDGTTHQMTMYMDGSLVSQKTTTVTPLLNLDPTQVPGLGIGNVQDHFDFPFLGAIDEVVLYNRVLSPSEVAILAVPEPAIGGLLGAGFLVLAIRRRLFSRE